MFPRPVSTTAGLVAASAKAFSESACHELLSAAACAAAAASGGCAWDAGAEACAVDPAAAGPWAVAPRVFNDLTFPYLVLTGLAAGLLALSWTPLWPVLVRVVRPVAAGLLRPVAAVWRELSGANYRGAPDGPDRATLEAEAARAARAALLAARPSYARALREGMFGNFPRDYDVTRISPWDEVLLAECVACFCGVGGYGLGGGGLL